MRQAGNNGVNNIYFCFCKFWTIPLFLCFYKLAKFSFILFCVRWVRPWENKKTIKAKSPSNIFRAVSVSDVFDQIYTGEIKKRGIPDDRNIRKSFTSKQNQPIMSKARDRTKI